MGGTPASFRRVAGDVAVFHPQGVTGILDGEWYTSSTGATTKR